MVANQGEEGGDGTHMQQYQNGQVTQGSIHQGHTNLPYYQKDLGKLQPQKINSASRNEDKFRSIPVRSGPQTLSQEKRTDKRTQKQT